MTRAPRSRGGRRILWISVLAFLSGIVAVELAFRWLLFGGGIAESLGRNLRHASYFADSASDDDFWKLFVELDRLQEPMSDASYHPELGWVSADLDSATLRHAGAAALQGRRPVLLFGDSYARCMGEREDCFEGLLGRSDLGHRYLLLNHGVQGYGLDQTHLLIERTIDRYLSERPVVVVALQVDDSIDRTILAIRGWPKPRLELRDGQLVPEFEPVPRMDAYLRENPVTFPSYAWRYLQFGTTLLPIGCRSWIRDELGIRERKEAISRNILEAIHAGLERRGVEHFFLLFYGEPYVDGSQALDWRDSALRAFFRERSVPFTSARRTILENAAKSGRPISDYYSQNDDSRRGHFRPEGNRAAFQALRDGIEGRFDPP
jgi:hypothetical protein